ncbi:MAG: zinc finger domain-containing protein [Planctomycetota bacterium]
MAGGTRPWGEGTLAARLRAAPHTLKRALCDPALFDGVGNVFSDEVLFHARLSPVQRPANLGDEEVARLHAAASATLQAWIDRRRAEVGDGFPDEVTAFHPAMAVHGGRGEPCLACGSPIQRIVHAENETNYCARCQTGGHLLKDRALSRLLKDDWPRSLDEL